VVYLQAYTKIQSDKDRLALEHNKHKQIEEIKKATESFQKQSEENIELP
jgi:hypothetical protein